MLEFFAGVFFLAYVLIVWFDTDGFMEYARLTRLYKLSKTARAYVQIKNQGSPMTFQEYLSQYHSDKFVIRLLTCLKCLAPWLSLLFCLVLAVFDWKLAVILLAPLAYISLLLYKIQKKLA